MDDITMTGTDEVSTIIEHADGTIEVDNSYINVKMQPTGSIETHIKADIQFISLQNITDVQSYRLMRVGELVVHNIEFNDGGTVDLRYTQTGKLVHFGAHRIRFQMTPQGGITIERFTQA